MTREKYIEELVAIYTKKYMPRITGEPPKIVKRHHDLFGETEQLILSDKYSITLQFVHGPCGMDILEQTEERREEKDWEAVNNCIFQKERSWILEIFDGWYCSDFLQLLEAYACGDLETVECILPNGLELCEYGYDFDVVGCNLMRAMHYKDEEIFREIVPQIEKFIGGKAAKWERSAIGFLYAVVKSEFDKAGECLLEMCKSYKRVLLGGASKKFCIYAHGVYCIAMKYLAQEDFVKIAIPNIDNFDREYAKWRISNKDIRPKSYCVFPESMRLVNLAFEIPVPQMSIYREDGKWGHLCKNTDVMRKQFIQQLKDNE